MEVHTNGNGFVYHDENFWESTDTAALDEALVAFNLEFKAVKRDETVAVPNRAPRKFASLDEIMIEIRPILAKHGIYVQQPITGERIITIVRHKTGQFRAFAMPMVAWQGQGTTAIQNLGGAITYMRRYSLGAALALATEEDDDGQSTGKLDIKRGQQNQKGAPAPTAETQPAPKLDDTVVDAWQSRVNDCKEPADFDRLSKEVKEIKNEPVKKFVKAAMSKRMEEVGVSFKMNDDKTGGEFVKSSQPTEKQA